MDFLKSNDSLVTELSNGYKFQNAESINPMFATTYEGVVKGAKDALEKEVPNTVEHLKESCKTELERYINSRGTSIDTEGFSPSLKTRVFRKDARTRSKVGAASELIKAIDNASSYEELSRVIKTPSENQALVKAKMKSGFKTCLNRCLLNLENAAIEKPELKTGDYLFTRPK